MAKKKSDLAEVIKVIYVYLVMIIGIGVLITGGFLTIRTVVNFAVYDEYPLDYYDDPCTRFTEAPDAKEPTETDLERCANERENLRKDRVVDDVTQSISSLLIGSILFVPHYRWSKHL